MRRWWAAAGWLGLAGGTFAAPVGSLPPLAVAPGGHLFETAAHRPFFWLGDTAWELIHRTTRDEAAFYLRTRARQGFTIVQTVVLAETDGLDTPTPDGLTPFAGDDPARPNPAYFDKVAWLVDEAARDGLYVALLPTWGDKLTAPWGTGPRIFTSPTVARAYGRFLARRLHGRTNIVWMLGGDRPATLAVPGAAPWFRVNAVQAGFAPDHDWTPIWAALAAGLAEGDPDAHRLVAYHPQGGPLSTSVTLGDAAWLDINAVQSGHGGGHDMPVWDWIARDYVLARPKPVIDLEPNYEDHPVDPWPQWDPATGRFTDYDVRKQLYRSVFAGAAGVTYGHHAVWQFTGPRYAPINFADRDWIDALHRPGAEAARTLADLIASRPDRVPDPALVVADPSAGARHLVAARDTDGSFALIYFPTADAATIDLARLAVGPLAAWWYDPRTGAATPLAGPVTGATHSFTPPAQGPDWVLVLDDPARHYAPPGIAR